MATQTHKIFISHNSKDKPIVDELRHLLACVPSAKVFCSSYANTSTTGGKSLKKQLDEAIGASTLVLMVGTSNYFRSVYCLYEMSVACFLSKRILPIVYDVDAYSEFAGLLGDIVYVDIAKADCAETLFKTFFSCFGVAYVTLAGCESITRLRPQGELQPYIASGHVYSDIIEYCHRYGVVRFSDTSMNAESVKSKIVAAREVKLLSTTGAALITMLSNQAFPEFLAQGGTLSVLLADKGSRFCRDVAFIENNEDAAENLRRITGEFDNVVFALKESLKKAAFLAGGTTVGKVFIGSCGTLLRQTVLLTEDAGGAGWGWVSVTVPPYRTKDGTPSFELKSDAGQTRSMYAIMNGHFEAIRKKAIVDGAYRELKAETVLERFSKEEEENGISQEKRRAEIEAWNEKYRRAERDRTAVWDGEDVLIEIAAQHPLRRGKTPGKEFRARLDCGIRLYREAREAGKTVRIYVPGSRHANCDVADAVSLSTAGKRYLIEQGVPASDIFSDEMNERYKGAAGVYNTADECYVAACIFKNEGDFGTLISVCSPSQTLKKMLFYIEQGLLAACWAVPVENAFHNPVYEAAEIIPNILYEDHTWQGEHSKYGIRTRLERVPREEKP